MRALGTYELISGYVEKHNTKSIEDVGKDKVVHANTKVTVVLLLYKALLDEVLSVPNSINEKNTE